MTKKLFLLVVLFFISISLFSEEWRISLGSFTNREKAQSQVNILKENGITTST